MNRNATWLAATALVFLAACKKDGHPGGAAPQIETITVENVLQSQPLVESGTFQ